MVRGLVRGAGGTALVYLAVACSGNVHGGTKQDIDVRAERVERINKSACQRVLLCERTAPSDETEPEEERGFGTEDGCLSEANTLVQMLVDHTDDNCTDAYLDFAECAARSNCEGRDPACRPFDLTRCPKEILDQVPLEGS